MPQVHAACYRHILLHAILAFYIRMTVYKPVALCDKQIESISLAILLTAHSSI